jgi:hypothetical protein
MSPVHTAPLLAAVLLAGGCSVASYGPLAVTNEPTDVVNAALGGTGTMVISSECVTLEDRRDGGGPITLVFRRAQVEWDATTRRVLFRDPFLGRILLSDGDAIEVGGSGMAGAGGLEPPTNSEWVATPNPSCPGELFEVHSIEILPGLT